MYTRVFQSILDSSINIQSVPPAHRWLWITMLLIADEERTGVVDLPVERLAARAGLSIEDTLKGLNFLMSPDTESRSEEEEGRRIIPLRESGRGWMLVNWEYYNKISSVEERREKTRERVRKYRENNKLKGCNAHVTKSNKSPSIVYDDSCSSSSSFGKSENLFLKFWDAYPKKKSKGQARKAWDKLKPNKELLTVILEALEKAKASDGWCKDRGKYIPHPATWLAAEGWLDSYETEIKEKSHWDWMDNKKEAKNA